MPSMDEVGPLWVAAAYLEGGQALFDTCAYAFRLMQTKPTRASASHCSLPSYSSLRKKRSDESRRGASC